jgi:hypothetical protein
MGVYFIATMGYPASPRSLRINKLAGKRKTITWNQQITGKIFHPKELRAIFLSKSWLLITGLAGSGGEVKK